MPAAARQTPDVVPPSTVAGHAVSQRLSAIRDAVSELAGPDSAAPARLAQWGNWRNGWHNWRNGWHNWHNGWHNWRNWHNY
jgi:hypothetical protein